MKAWIMELCPEIAEWQAEAIEEYHKSAVKLAREAVVEELIAGSGEPAMHMIVDAQGTVAPYYTTDQLAGAVLRERERAAEVCKALRGTHWVNIEAGNVCADAIRGQT